MDSSVLLQTILVLTVVVAIIHALGVPTGR
jgi:hypothetical protein